MTAFCPVLAGAEVRVWEGAAALGEAAVLAWVGAVASAAAVLAWVGAAVSAAAVLAWVGAAVGRV